VRICVSPSFKTDNTVFVYSKGDGIFKSEDGGDSWFRINKGLNKTNLDTLAVSPEFYLDKIVLAGGTTGGLFRSKNGGEYWTQVLSDTIKVNAITFLYGPEGPKVLLGDKAGNLHVSTNGGETWQVLASIPDAGAITCISIPPEASRDSTWLLGTEKKGIFSTVDGGDTWNPLNINITDKHITSVAFSPDYTKDSTIFACTWYEAVYISSDKGKTWKKYSTGITTDSQADEPRFRCPHFSDIQISKSFQTDKTLFLAGFDGLFKSKNGGTKWIQLETLPAKEIIGLDIRSVNENNNLIAIATAFGGNYIKGRQRRDSWEVCNRGLRSNHPWGIKFSPEFDSDTTMFSWLNRDLCSILKNVGDSWHQFPVQEKKKKLSSIFAKVFNSGIGKNRQQRASYYPWKLVISPDFQFDNTIYVGTRYGGLVCSGDSGRTWSNVFSPESGWITSLDMSPNFSNDKTLYASVRFEGIYKTIDGGRKWRQVNKGLDMTAIQSHRTPYNLFLAVSPDYKFDRTVFLGTTTGLYKTVNGGDSWERVVCPVLGEQCYVRAVAISPNYQEDKTALISIQGKGLFKSCDGCSTFVEAGSTLIKNNYCLNVLMFSPTYATDNTICAGGEELFCSKDGGNTWVLIPRPVRYEDYFSDYIQLQGKWEVARDANYSCSTLTRSDTVNSKIILPFVGTGVTWIGTNSANQGIGKVYVDNKFMGFVDQFAPSRDVIVKSFSVDKLEKGAHTIQIVVTGTKNPKSSGYAIEIDGFDVIQ
jgi:photosystem II stability/assembly factor-like uncharacterized protein